MQILLVFFHESVILSATTYNRSFNYTTYTVNPISTTTIQTVILTIQPVFLYLLSIRFHLFAYTSHVGYVCELSIFTLVIVKMRKCSETSL